MANTLQKEVLHVAHKRTGRRTIVVFGNRGAALAARRKFTDAGCMQPLFGNSEDAWHAVVRELGAASD